MGNELCALLNEALRLDPVAVTRLVQHRVMCNKDIVNHPNIIVGTDSWGEDTLGVIGLLNGLFTNPNDRIKSLWSEDGKVLLGFKVKV